MIFLVGFSLNSLEIVYSKAAISENIGIPRHPILGGRDNNLVTTL